VPRATGPAWWRRAVEAPRKKGDVVEVGGVQMSRGKCEERKNKGGKEKEEERIQKEKNI